MWSENDKSKQQDKQQAMGKTRSETTHFNQRSAAAWLSVEQDSKGKQIRPSRTAPWGGLMVKQDTKNEDDEIPEADNWSIKPSEQFAKNKNQ